MVLFVVSGGGRVAGTGVVVVVFFFFASSASFFSSASALFIKNKSKAIGARAPTRPITAGTAIPAIIRIIVIGSSLLRPRAVDSGSVTVDSLDALDVL